MTSVVLQCFNIRLDLRDVRRGLCSVIQLVRNCELIACSFELHRGSIGCSWLPAYHDMGLVGGILTPLYLGFLCSDEPDVLFATTRSLAQDVDSIWRYHLRWSQLRLSALRR